MQGYVASFLEKNMEAAVLRCTQAYSEGKRKYRRRSYLSQDALRTYKRPRNSSFTRMFPKLLDQEAEQQLKDQVENHEPAMNVKVDVSTNAVDATPEKRKIDIVQLLKSTPDTTSKKRFSGMFDTGGVDSPRIDDLATFVQSDVDFRKD